jgi:hypothetical protein
VNSTPLDTAFQMNECECDEKYSSPALKVAEPSYGGINFAGELEIAKSMCCVG